jgi:hypothetical protein
LKLTTKMSWGAANLERSSGSTPPPATCSSNSQQQWLRAAAVEVHNTPSMPGLLWVEAISPCPLSHFQGAHITMSL